MGLKVLIGFSAVMGLFLLVALVQVARISGDEINRRCRDKCAPYSWDVGTVGMLGKEMVCTCDKFTEIR